MGCLPLWGSEGVTLVIPLSMLWEEFLQSKKNWSLQELLMGVETPIPLKMITPAAPDGVPPRRIKTVEKIICRFSWPGCEPDRFMSVSPRVIFFHS